MLEGTNTCEFCKATGPEWVLPTGKLAFTIKGRSTAPALLVCGPCKDFADTNQWNRIVQRAADTWAEHRGGGRPGPADLAMLRRMMRGVREGITGAAYRREEGQRPAVHYTPMQEWTGDPARDALIAVLFAVEDEYGESRGWDQEPELLAMHMPGQDSTAVAFRSIHPQAWVSGMKHAAEDLAAAARSYPKVTLAEAGPPSFADSPDGFAALALMNECWALAVDPERVSPAEALRMRLGLRGVPGAHPDRKEIRVLTAVDVAGYLYRVTRVRGEEPQLEDVVQLDPGKGWDRISDALALLVAQYRIGAFPPAEPVELAACAHPGADLPAPGAELGRDLDMEPADRLVAAMRDRCVLCTDRSAGDVLAGDPMLLGFLVVIAVEGLGYMVRLAGWDPAEAGGAALPERALRWFCEPAAALMELVRASPDGGGLGRLDAACGALPAEVRRRVLDEVAEVVAGFVRTDGAADNVAAHIVLEFADPQVVAGYAAAAGCAAPGAGAPPAPPPG